MNNKESEAYRLLDISIQCCSTTNKDGSSSINKEDVLGKNRTENVIMTHCVFINLLLHSGYSYSTIANILNKTIPANNNSVSYNNGNLIIAESKQTIQSEDEPQYRNRNQYDDEERYREREDYGYREHSRYG